MSRSVVNGKKLRSRKFIFHPSLKNRLRMTDAKAPCACREQTESCFEWKSSCGRFKVFIRIQKIGNIFSLLWLFFYFPSHVKLFLMEKSLPTSSHAGLINSCVNLYKTNILKRSLALDWGHELMNSEATLSKRTGWDCLEEGGQKS